MPTYDESGEWMWDEATGQWMPTATAPTADAPAPQPPQPAAQQSPSAPQPAAPARRPACLIPLIAVLALCALLGLCGIGGTLFFAFNNQRTAAQQAAVQAAARQAALEAQLKAGALFTTPNEAVHAWYAAVQTGDVDKMRSTATSEFAARIDETTLAGRDRTANYKIMRSSVGDKGMVVVEEFGGSKAETTTVTFTIVKTPNGYLISGFSTASARSPAGVPGQKLNQTAAISRAEAIDVVGRILDARKNSEVDKARSLATPKFQQESADVFFTPTGDAFLNFEVTGSAQRGDVWYIDSKEDWISGTEHATYAVVTVGGKGLVDGWETSGQ